MDMKQTGKNKIKNIIYKINILWIDLVLIVVLLLMMATFFFVEQEISVAVAAIVLAILVATVNVLVIWAKKRRAKKAARELGISDANGKVCEGLLDSLQLPAFIITENCRLVWSNDEFKKLCEETEQKQNAGKIAGGIFTKHIKSRLNPDGFGFVVDDNDASIKTDNEAASEPATDDEGLDIEWGDGGTVETFQNNATDASQKTAKISKFMADSIDFNNGKKKFNIYATYVIAQNVSDGEATICVYLVDVSGVNTMRKLYRDRKIVIGEIIVDNYDEIFQTNGESVVNNVLVEVNNIFETWLKGKNAIVKQLMRERFIIMADMKSIDMIMKERFAVLEEVKKISKGNSIPVTLSIGISTNASLLTDEAFDELISGGINHEICRDAFADTLQEHFASSDELVKLCISRGGDQAVVEMGPNENKFFGGSETEAVSGDMVQIRVTAEQLRDAITSASRVLIMGHKFADLDALGAALAARRIAVKIGKPAYIVLEKSNQQIDVMYRKLIAEPSYNGVFIAKNEALNILDDETLTVVVDTFSEQQAEAPEVIAASKKVGIIDHHRIGVDHIKNTVFSHADVQSSSASELMVEITRFLFGNEKIFTKLELEALYAGILVDTKNLFFRTRKRTFNVAAYLRDSGAIPLDIRSYTQPSIEEFKRVSAIVTDMKAEEIDYKNGRRKVAFAISKDSEDSRVIAAMAADRMLEIAGIDCAFVLVEDGTATSVKARSLGRINVQTIMENPKIGGGGHLTAAAAFVKDKTPAEVKKQIMKILKENG